MFKVIGQVNPSIFDKLIGFLDERPLPVNNYRIKSGKGRSQCFGLVRQRNGRYAGSRHNYERIEIFKELKKIAKKLPPDFPFTSIQVNQNYQTAPHKDKGNKNDSIIVGFGDYTGGDLVIEETPVDIKNTLVAFNGNLLVHSTKPWEGNRYSLVFHTVDRDFKELPLYEIVKSNEEFPWLRETLGGVSRLFDRKGENLYSSDGLAVKISNRKPRLREAIE